ncbi:MAG: hypothetical protein ONB14_08905 [candidate division KSB1 bacterium]|nr:hypothetical protein [candidate division KSB1 bacterium]MDZ7385139.1 hypothetical protein [candidate division KSB1 bacterium]MDZ7391567.1 hypothetical protein [candidate division KSB1 bacterium]MDZ7413891.1 hypothetical protein [candidate division KSB1 bacterium]
MLFRVLLLALLAYLALRVWRLLAGFFTSQRPPVKGAGRQPNPPLDLEGKDVEEAKYREVNDDSAGRDQ